MRTDLYLVKLGLIDILAHSRKCLSFISTKSYLDFFIISLYIIAVLLKKAAWKQCNDTRVPYSFQ